MTTKTCTIAKTKLSVRNGALFSASFDYIYNYFPTMH